VTSIICELPDPTPVDEPDPNVLWHHNFNELKVKFEEEVRLFNLKCSELDCMRIQRDAEKRRADELAAKLKEKLTADSPCDGADPNVLWHHNFNELKVEFDDLEVRLFNLKCSELDCMRIQRDFEKKRADELQRRIDEIRKVANG
jgi:hypothetical protein